MSEEFTPFDDQVIELLKARDGKHLPTAKIADHFNATLLSMRFTLQRLVDTKRVREFVLNGRKNFHIPNAQQLADMNKVLERRDVKPYQMPAQMQERYAELVAHRKANPSKFD